MFRQINVGLLVLNSALVTGLIALGQMASATLAGYAFARLDFRGKKAIFSLVLATMMVPVQVTIVPVFMLIRGDGSVRYPAGPDPAGHSRPPSAPS